MARFLVSFELARRLRDELADGLREAPVDFAFDLPDNGTFFLMSDDRHNLLLEAERLLRNVDARESAQARAERARAIVKGELMSVDEVFD